MKKGAKSKCTKELVDKAYSLKSIGLTNKDTATAIGIAETTFSKWLHHPETDMQKEFSERIKKADSNFKASLLEQIIEQGKDKDWRALCWILERRYPEEYAKPEVQLARKIAKATMEQADDALSASLKELAKTL